jgi:hypothetical protein
MIDDVENDRKIRLDLKLLFADWLNYDVKDPDVPDIQNFKIHVTQKQMDKFINIFSSL